MKFRIIGSIIVVAVVLGLTAFFSKEEDSYQVDNPVPRATEFGSDAINSMKQ